MKIKRNDGKVLEFDFPSYGRGSWGVNLVAVDGCYMDGCQGDPAYRTEREARRAARQSANNYEHVPGLGWCVTS